MKKLKELINILQAKNPTLDECIQKFKIKKNLALIIAIVGVAAFGINIGFSLYELIKQIGNIFQLIRNVGGVFFVSYTMSTYINYADKNINELKIRQAKSTILKEQSNSNEIEIDKKTERIINLLSRVKARRAEHLINALEYAVITSGVSITNFSILESLLENSPLTLDEKIEIITFYYSKNYKFYDGRNEQYFNQRYNSEIKYSTIKQRLELVKEYIDENGEILAKKNDVSDQEIKIINLNNCLELDRKYIIRILQIANSKWYKQSKLNEEKSKLQSEYNDKMAKIASGQLEISEALIESIINLMHQLQLGNIEQTKQDLVQKMQESKAQKNIINDEKEQRKKAEILAASKLVNEYIDLEYNNTPLRYVPFDVFEKLQKAFVILGYNNDKIALLSKKITQTNLLLDQELDNQAKEVYLVEILEVIGNIDETLSADKTYDLYQKAQYIILNPEALDKSLNYYREPIEVWINVINEILLSNLGQPITEIISNNIKAALLELDKIFSEIFEINNSSNRNLIKFDEIPN